MSTPVVPHKLTVANSRTAQKHAAQSRSDNSSRSSKVSSPPSMPEPQKTVLPSGVRVLSEYLPSAQSFALGAWIDVGSGDELPSEHGIVHFIEHVVFRGTARRSAKQIANQLESVGGYLNAFTTKDHTSYYARALMPHFDLSLSVLTDLCAAPLFRAADVEKERNIILEEMKSLDEEPEETITDVLDESLFGDHPFAHPIAGTLESMHHITEQHIRAFHTQHYTQDRIVIAASGAIDHDEFCRRVETLLGAVPHTSALPASDVPVPERLTAKRGTSAPPRTTKTMPTSQAHSAWGALLPDISNAEQYTLSALSIILGDGMSSRLNQIIREKHGLCYNIYSAVSEIKSSIIFSIYAGSEVEQYTNVEQLCQQELRTILEKPVTKQELRRAKEQLKSSLIIGLESLSGRMTFLAKSELYMGRFETVEEKIVGIEAVTADDILTLANEYLRLQDWHTVSILPEETAAE
jgi:predicted Zn-dependent peptidase